MKLRGATSSLLLAGALALALSACSTSSDTAGDDTAPARLAGDVAAASFDDLRINELQYIGTHNSYHVAPTDELFAAEKAAMALLGEDANALGNIDSLLYTHDSLTDQLEQGIRAFELDIFADPEGGLFSDPLAPALLGVDGGDIPAAMDTPGMKVVHIQDVDFRSTCPTLVACLTEIETWSTANPDHVPIFVQIEAKDDMLPAPLDATTVVNFDAAQLDALDAEIRSVFDDDQLIVPDAVRGDADSLHDAVTTTGWPTVGESRGKVLFFLDNGGRVHDAYLDGHDGLDGRVIFTSAAEEGADDRAVVKLNDPSDDRIAAAVEAGYIVRTRSDADLVESWTNDTGPRDAALSSGAQIVSTDFPNAKRSANGYVVSFDHTTEVRCNAVIVVACPTDKIDG